MRPWLFALLGALAVGLGYIVAGGVGLGIGLALVLGAAYVIALDRFAGFWQKLFERRH